MRSLGLASIVLFSCALPLQARTGKVFFSSDRWLKGDIQVRADESGKELIVIAMPSGSVTVDRSEIRSIVYSPRAGGSPGDRKFERALANTPAEPKAVSAAPVLYDPYIRQASAKHRVDPELVKAVIRQESNYNPFDVSNKGAQGLMQLMPDTARGLGVRDPFDPYQNIHGGTLYLRYMLETFHGDVVKALAAYNAGPEAVLKYGTVPPYRETQEYVRRVMHFYRIYRRERLHAYEDHGRLVFTDLPYIP